MKVTELRISIVKSINRFKQDRKQIFLKVLPICAILGIITIPMANSATHIRPDSIITQKQNTKNTKNITNSIQVALSDSVLIHINAGGSRSGDFVDLNNKSLLIAIQGSSQTIPLSSIKKVEFQEGVWIPASSTEICQNSYRNCRKFRGSDRTNKEQRTWQNVPVNAFDLPEGSKTAFLKLQGILDDEDWRDLIDQSNDIVHIIDEIEMKDSGAKMTIKATPVDRKKN